MSLPRLRLYKAHTGFSSLASLILATKKATFQPLEMRDKNGGLEEDTREQEDTGHKVAFRNIAIFMNRGCPVGPMRRSFDC